MCVIQVVLDKWFPLSPPAATFGRRSGASLYYIVLLYVILYDRYIKFVRLNNSMLDYSILSHSISTGRGRRTGRASCP